MIVQTYGRNSKMGGGRGTGDGRASSWRHHLEAGKQIGFRVGSTTPPPSPLFRKSPPSTEVTNQPAPHLALLWIRQIQRIVAVGVVGIQLQGLPREGRQGDVGEGEGGERGVHLDAVWGGKKTKEG